MNLARGSKQFGNVSIAWETYEQITPIGVWHENLNGDKVYCLNCDLVYTIGTGADAIQRTVPMFDDSGARWTFDGASIPWYIDLLPGFDKLGWHVWGVIPHDLGCEHEDKIPRTISDAIFLEVLKSSKPERYWHAAAMYAGVRLYSIGKAWRARN